MGSGIWICVLCFTIILKHMVQHLKMTKWHSFFFIAAETTLTMKNKKQTHTWNCSLKWLASGFSTAIHFFQVASRSMFVCQLLEWRWRFLAFQDEASATQNKLGSPGLWVQTKVQSCAFKVEYSIKTLLGKAYCCTKSEVHTFKDW